MRPLRIAHIAADVANRVVNMAVDGQQIQPAVEIDVGKQASEAQSLSRRGPYLAPRRYVAVYSDIAPGSQVGTASRKTLGFGCLFADIDLDGRLDLLAVNGHIDDTVRNIRRDVGYAQRPHLFLNQGEAGFR